jgi:hypothetical protein
MDEKFDFTVIPDSGGIEAFIFRELQIILRVQTVSP